MRVKLLGTRRAPISIREIFSRMGLRRVPAVTVARREIPYWQERGWTRDGNRYTGSYQTPYAAFQGWIDVERSGHIMYYLLSPSTEIQISGHWACFAQRANGWYLVHMSRRPKDVSSGIITIERLITEAYQ
ncbi:MAG: hypothetical protein JO340_16015 [Acidobacteriaceae bacterium]|nr:hypothetical protein [Acidobacteriaceae bacterium]